MPKVTTLIPILLLAPLLVLPATVPVLAASGFLGFNAIDRDADGTISAAEVSSYRERLFRTLDSDGDGSVSLQDWLAATMTRADTAQGREIQAEFEDMDRTGSGRITLEDMLRQGAERFQALDRDNDGRLTREEAAAGPL